MADNMEYDTTGVSYAGEDNKKYLDALRDAVKQGDITIGQLQKMADDKGINITTLIEYTTMSRLEMEQNPYYKSDLSEQETIVPNDPNVLKKGESVEVAGCKITCLSEGSGTGDYMGRKYKCESDYLGTFEYNPYEFEIGYKEIEEDDGSTSQLPVLHFCGTGVLGGHRGVDVKFLWWDIGTAGDTTVNIPDGVKSIDYTFTDDETLEKVPDMPNSITSAHYAFAGCSKMDMETDGQTNLKFTQLPHNLEDMSGMFKDCTSISGYFCTKSSGTFAFDGKGSEIPSSVVNITEAWNGCESMDDVQFPNWFGGYTYSMPGYGDMKTPYLCADFAKDALAGISDNNSQRYEKDHGESVKDYADGREYVIESGGTINPDYAEFAETLDQDKLDESQAAGAQVEQGKIRLGAVFTDAELASNNARSDNKIYDYESGTYVNDETGEKKSDNVIHDAWWERAIVDGAAGLGIFGVVSSLTDSKLAGLAAGAASVFALDHFNILPKSLYPILTFTANILPDCAIKDKLNEWAEALPGASTRHYNDSVEEYNKQWDDSYNVAVAHKEARLTNIFQAANSVLYQDIGLSMKNNGEDCAKTLTFAAVAGEGDSKVSCVSETIKPAVDAMTAKWCEDIAKDGITDDIKGDMKDYYTELMKALESYNEGANAGITNSFVIGTPAYELSHEGLGMVNREYTKVIMDSLVEMNKQYQFMDDKAWSDIQSLSIEGINVENIKNYNSSYFTKLEADSKAAREEMAKKFQAERQNEDAQEEEQKDAQVSTAAPTETPSETSSDTTFRAGIVSGMTGASLTTPEIEAGLSL